MFLSLEVCSEENASPCTSSLYSVWLLQACVVMLQHSLHVQCLSEASGRMAHPAAMDVCFGAQLHLCLTPPFGIDSCCAPASLPQCWAFEISLRKSRKADVRAGDMVVRRQPWVQLEDLL